MAVCWLISVPTDLLALISAKLQLLHAALSCTMKYSLGDGRDWNYYFEEEKRTCKKTKEHTPAKKWCTSIKWMYEHQQTLKPPKILFRELLFLQVLK